MRCKRCMQKIPEQAQTCPICGFPQDTPQQDADALPAGTLLRNRFMLGRELGRGGFGITYIAFDEYLECKVAIKEYFPQTVAARMPGEVNIFWLNKRHQDTGCTTVIHEAKKMHMLGNLSAAVRVQDVFYENNTAYIAMDYIEGVTLKDYMRRTGMLSVGKCLKMIFPVLDTMSQMHSHGIIHRDISPDNIMVQPDEQMRILDLGAAKDVHTETGHTALVARNGFSPKEQYQTTKEVGGWTDVYALCATIYYALLGKVPPFAMDREDNDPLPFPSGSNVPEELQHILNEGMRPRPEKRIRTVQALKNQLEQFLQNWKTDETEKETPPHVEYSPSAPVVSEGVHYEEQVQNLAPSQQSAAQPQDLQQNGQQEFLKSQQENVQQSYQQEPEHAPIQQHFSNQNYRQIGGQQAVRQQYTNQNYRQMDGQHSAWQPYSNQNYRQPMIQQPAQKQYSNQNKQQQVVHQPRSHTEQQIQPIVIKAEMTHVSDDKSIEQEKDIQKGFMSKIGSLLGRGRKSANDAKTVREPAAVIIPSPDVAPVYSDPNATVCADEEGTVLFDEEIQQSAAGYLLQETSGVKIPIRKCVFILGRYAPAAPGSRQITADCMIEDKTKHISRSHAAILFDGEAYYLHDISIKNATYLNGIRLLNGAMPEDRRNFSVAYRLSDGDVIQLVEEKLVFHTGGSV